jgi:hypothetical protein
MYEYRIKSPSSLNPDLILTLSPDLDCTGLHFTGDKDTPQSNVFFVNVFGRLECVAHFFSYVAHVVFLRDVWIRTHRAAVASRRALPT